jgi:hypothetical protein
MSLAEFTGFGPSFAHMMAGISKPKLFRRTLMEQQGNRIAIGLEMREKVVPLGKYGWTGPLVFSRLQRNRRHSHRC